MRQTMEAKAEAAGWTILRTTAKRTEYLTKNGTREWISDSACSPGFWFLANQD